MSSKPATKRRTAKGLLIALAVMAAFTALSFILSEFFSAILMPAIMISIIEFVFAIILIVTAAKRKMDERLEERIRYMQRVAKAQNAL